MSNLLAGLLDDLATESEELATVVTALGDGGWHAPTPAVGWTVATTVAHLAWTDEVAILAARSVDDEEARRGWDGVVAAALVDPLGAVDAAAHRIAAEPRSAVLDRWQSGRHGLREALLAVPTGHRLPWFGPPMSPTSMATARFMETWAHALDVHDAAGSRPEPTDRIRHVAHLGVRTRDFAFSGHGQDPPPEPFGIELTAPSGESWTWGPRDAGQRVRGSAYDFCLLVTQRVHRVDTDLVATGADADRWLDLAQAFAGLPGAGRDPRAEGVG